MEKKLIQKYEGRHDLT